MDNPGADDLKEHYEDALARQHILEEASHWLVQFNATEKFLRLLGRCLTLTFGASHATVFIDKGPLKGYLVAMSCGTNKIPPSLVRLDRPSHLIQDLKQRKKGGELSIGAQAEMRRLGAELCIPIFGRHKSDFTGFLTVGPRTNGIPYEPDSIEFFNTLGNDIAVEIEKETYYYSSIHDPLTGLFNRKHLDETFKSLCKRGYSSKMAIALLDIDHFKDINDTYGHQIGDKILQIVAEKIVRNVRKGDTCYRYGGEEFCILFLDLSQRDGTPLESQSALFFSAVHKLVERLRQNIGENVVCIDSLELHVSVSIGLSFFNVDPENPIYDARLKEADELLYAAKRAGRNRVFLSTPYS